MFKIGDLVKGRVADFVGIITAIKNNQFKVYCNTRPAAVWAEDDLELLARFHVEPDQNAPTSRPKLTIVKP